jgi:hypothetical protein
MDATFTEFKAQAQCLGHHIDVVEKPSNHWQIKIGRVTVNYYPNSRNQTVYINKIPGVIEAQRHEGFDHKRCLSLVQGIYNKLNT